MNLHWIMPAKGRVNVRPFCCGMRVNLFMNRLKDRNLYLVITEEYCRGRTAVEVARRAIAGGVDIVQMREKDRQRAELIAKGKELLAVCRTGGVPLIINDDPKLALEIGADGVHLGQEDLQRFPIEKARGLVGPDGIIGISTHSLAQFREAEGWDVDYIAFGPVFPTKIKDYSIGTSDVKTAASSAKKDIFFIGGINLSNVKKLSVEGCRKIAVIRAITEAEEIEDAARLLKKEVMAWQ